MICIPLLKSITAGDVSSFSKAVIDLGRTEFETPQVVYRFSCACCGSTHTIDIPLSECPHCGTSESTEECLAEVWEWLRGCSADKSFTMMQEISH